MIFDLERAFQLVFLLDYNGLAIMVIGSLNRRFAFQQASLQIEPAILSLSDRCRNTAGKRHRSIAILRQRASKRIVRNYRQQRRIVQTATGTALLYAGAAFRRSGTGRRYRSGTRHNLRSRTRTAAILQTGTKSSATKGATVPKAKAKPTTQDSRFIYRNIYFIPSKRNPAQTRKFEPNHTKL